MPDVNQKINLDVNQPVSGLEKLAGLTDNLDNALKTLGSSQKDSFTKATNAVQDFNKELADGTKIYQKIQASSKAFSEEQKRLKGVLEQLRKSQKQFIAEGRYEELQKNIAGVKARIKELGGSLDEVSTKQKKVTSEGGSMFQKFGGIVAGAFALGTVVAWAKQIGAAVLNVTAEFQKFEAVLTTSLGSNSAAERAMLMIQDFAAKTPFSVQELTDSYVKLAGRGIRPTAKELTALGDLAASTGKSFDQLTEAVLDSMSGEQERLKEFGILAKKTGETTQFTFKGVTTEVKNTDSAIKEYLISLGSIEGVTGSMAAISETLTGRISNLGDGLDQLFLTIGQQETGVMASFIGFLSDAVSYTTFLISNTDQLAEKLAAGAVTEFATQTEADFKKLADSVKASGGDVTAALTAQSEALRVKLEQDLKQAQAYAKEIEGMSGGIAGFLANPMQYGLNKGAEAAVIGNEKEIQGKLNALADAQRLVEADLAKKTNAEAAERAEAASKAARENAKKEAAARKKALADLYKELERLEKEADKARLNMLDKNSKAYLKAQFDADLKAIAELEATITELQRKAGQSTFLTAEQQEQLQALTLEANKRYFDALYKLQQAENDKLLDLQKDSDTKALQQLQNKYDAEIRAAEEAGNREIAVALRIAKERDLIQLKRAQAEKNLGTDKELAIAFSEATIPEGMSREAAQRALQERILAINIEFAEKNLALVANSLEKEDRIKALQLKNEIQRLKDEQNALKENSEQFSLKKLLGLDDEQLEAVNAGVNIALNNLSEFLAATVELRRREVEALTQAIDEKGEELDREIELNKQGFASNVAARQEEYNQLKEQREKAMKDQQKAQRNQVLLDSATQASNLITSSTEIYKVLSPLGPIGIGVAIATIATMFGTFFAAKAKALQAAKAPTFEKGGGFQLAGASHREGGIELIDSRSGNKLAEYEGKEYLFAINKNSTAKHLKLLEAINKDDKVGISRYALDELLSGTGVIPHPELPQKLQAIQAGAKVSQHQAAGVNLTEMNSYLKQISEHTQPAPQITETEDGTIIRQGNRTRIIKKHV